MIEELNLLNDDNVDLRDYGSDRGDYSCFYNDEVYLIKEEY